MDELLERGEQKRTSVKVGSELVSVMAFDGNLVLTAEDPGDMQVLLKCCENFFNKKGLSVSSTKCVSLKVLPVKGKKSLKVITAVHQYWKGEPIPNIYFQKLGKKFSDYTLTMLQKLNFLIIHGKHTFLPDSFSEVKSYQGSNQQ